MKIKQIISDLQDYYLLSLQGLAGVFAKPFYLRDTIEQMDYAGAGSFLSLCLWHFLLGWRFRFSCLPSSAGWG